jgi:hypothetical protein
MQCIYIIISVLLLLAIFIVIHFLWIVYICINQKSGHVDKIAVEKLLIERKVGKCKS